MSVPFYHWSGAEDEERKALLRRLIAEARAEPTPEIMIPQGPFPGDIVPPSAVGRNEMHAVADAGLQG